MQTEYFLSSDGNAPPRGNRWMPAAADSWIPKLLAESAVLRQNYELKMSAGDSDRLMGDPLQSIVHHRVPIASAPTETIHNFRASLGLPTAPLLPIAHSDVCASEDGSACSMDSEDEVGMDTMFPFQPRECFTFPAFSPPTVEKIRWSLAEDRLLLQLDSTYQALTEGYLQMQSKFPNLFPKNVDEWIAVRQHGDKIRREVGDLARDAVDMADPELLKSQKGLRASVMESLPRGAEYVQSDAVFRHRLQVLKASQDRQNILLSLPEDPTIFLPPASTETETKQLIPAPKSREPTFSERQEALRSALFSGASGSRDAFGFLNSSEINSAITCVSKGAVAKVPCNFQAVIKSAPFFEKQCEFGNTDMRLDDSDEYWNKEMDGAFDENTVKKFVALCHNPNLLPKIHSLQNERDAMQSSFESVYVDFCNRTQSSHQEQVAALKEEKALKSEMSRALFRDMLAEDINALTRIYRQHVGRELRQLERTYNERIDQVNDHFAEELGYLKLAKAHFRPSELKALEERTQLVESILQKDILGVKDIPNVLKMTEAVLASSVKSQVLQAMADQMPKTGPSAVLSILANPFVSTGTITEFLSLLPDTDFVSLYAFAKSQSIVPNNTNTTAATEVSSFTNSSFGKENSSMGVLSVSSQPAKGPTTSPVMGCLNSEWTRRAESKRQQLRAMPLVEVGRIHQQVMAYRQGKVPATPFADWEDLLVEVLSSNHQEGIDRLLSLSEANGARGSLASVGAGAYDVSLCSAGSPVVVSSIPYLRVGESSTIVYFEMCITSAFQPDRFPYGVQIGLEPIKGCLNHVQQDALVAYRLKEAAEAGAKGKRSTAIREDERSYSQKANDRRVNIPGGISPPGIFSVNVASDGPQPLPVFGCGWSSDGLLYIDGQPYCVQEGFGEGDVVGMSLDLLTGTVSWYKNNAVVTLTNFSTSRPIPAVLAPIVAYAPSVSLLSTATRNGIPNENAVENVISSVISRVNPKYTAPAPKSSTLTQLEVLTARIQLSEPFKCAVAKEQNKHFVGFAQAVEM